MMLKLKLSSGIYNSYFSECPWLHFTTRLCHLTDSSLYILCLTGMQISLRQ